MTNAVNIAQSGSNNQTMRNRIINGAMTISQRNGTSSVTPTTLYSQYTLDRWTFNGSQASKASVQQDAGGVTPPAGFTDYLGITSLSAYSVLSNDFFGILQHIEGFNTADLAFGTASAQPVTLSFWVRSSLTGTFGGNLANSANNRNYVFSYTISAANTWEYKTITVPGDTTGTWLTTNGIGLQVVFSIGSGSNFTAAPGSWSASATYAPTGQTSIVGTNGATFYITGVQLEEGTAASPFENRLYGTELSLCYRYFQKFLGSSAYEALPTYVVATAGTSAEGFLAYKGTMRSTPTLAISTLCLLDGTGVFPVSGANTGGNGVDSMRINYTGISSMTQFRSYYVTSNNSTSAFLTLSSEL
jgi:hypothetical protein